MHNIGRLKELIVRNGRAESWANTAIPGLYLSHWSTTCVPRTTIDRALFCIVAQGAKEVLLNGLRYRYDASKYLLVSMDLPVVGEIVEASHDKPYLGFSMELDLSEVARLTLEADLPLNAGANSQKGLSISPISEGLVDAAIRLVGLLETPAQIPVLAPMIQREILYKLLLSEQSGLLRRMVAAGSQATRIAAGVDWLRRNALRPVKMEELARQMHMSPSTMHAWFKAVTMMSPLQFQKQLRLQQARQMMLGGEVDAATVSQRVGYESPSQFSREYRRLFGEPPVRDIVRLRAGMQAV